MKGAGIVLQHLGQTFPTRMAEWFLGVVLFNWGLILIRPEETFNYSTSYAGLVNLAPEDWWAWGCLVVGGARLVALFINGAWVPPTYRLRSITSFLSLLFWFSISYGMMFGSNATTGLAVYPAMALLEYGCLWRTGRDFQLHKMMKQQETEQNANS